MLSAFGLHPHSACTQFSATCALHLTGGIAPRRFPDYFQIIAQPISLKEIKRKINNGDLNTVESAKEKIDLMFANARQYNMEGSEVLQDVDAMEVSAAAFVSLYQSHHSCSYLRFPLGA